jgi:DNA-directed RNA polymerase subunit omega
MDLTNLMAGIDEMKIDSRYRLVIVTAQRARQLMQGSKPLIQSKFSKEITIALDETLQGLCEYIVGDEAKAALEKARQKEATAKPKVLASGPDDAVEIKKDLTKYVDDSKTKPIEPVPENKNQPES